MAKDFRAERVRIQAIVGTGSISNTRPNLGLLVYSSSQAADWRGNVYDTNMLQNVGSDVWMYVSGAASGDGTYKADQRIDGGAVLFGGDVVVSGTLWAERSIIEVDGTIAGDLRAPNRIISGLGATNLATGRSLFLADPFTINTVNTNRPGTVSFRVVDGTGGAYSYSTTNNKDVFFHVSGSRGVKDSDDRGLALFDGDVHVSGNLSLSPESLFTVPGDLSIGGDLTVTGSLILSGNEILDSAHQPMIRFNGKGDINTFAPLTSSSPGTSVELNLRSDKNFAAIYMLNHQEIGVPGIVPDDGEELARIFMGAGHNSNPRGGGIQVFAAEDWDDSVLTTGTKMKFNVVPVGYRLPKTRLEIRDTTTAVSGNLKLNQIVGAAAPDGDVAVSYPSILDDGNNAVMTLSGSGDATFNNNVTVVGNLNVSGSVTSIATDNLRVSDQVILMASGSTSVNTEGGIAIASGSSIVSEALVFGKGVYNNHFRAGRKDVTDGSVTTLSDSTPVNVEVAGIDFGSTVSATPTLIITASVAGALTHLTASTSGGSGGDILLQSENKIRLMSLQNVHIAGGQKLYFDDDGTGDGGSDVFLTEESGGLTFQVGDTVAPALFRIRSRTGTLDEIRFSSGDYGDSPNRIRSLHGAAFSSKQSRLQLSGSGVITINNRAAAPGAGIPTSLSTVISASSDEVNGGGPVIILSSSAEYGGGTSREGFIMLGASSEAGGLFSMSRHRDVRTLLSGAVGTRGSNQRGVTLITGDLVVSGNTNFVGSTDIGSIATDNLTLQSATSGEPYIRFRSSDVQIRRDAAGSLEFDDTQAPGAPYTLTQLASLAVTDNSDVFAVTHQNGSAPYLSYVASTGSFSFDHDPAVDGYVPRRANQIGDDAYFFVSGSIGSKDYNYSGGPSRPGNGQRGTAVFGGDIHVSGSFYADNPTFWTSLHAAYSTPDTPGLKQFSDLSAGAGAVIDTSNSGIPLQLRNPALASAPGVNNNFGPVLSLTGSLDFSHSGGTNNPRIKMQTDHSFQFHNSDGEVFRLVAGNPSTGVNTHARFISTNQLRFNQDTMYVRGVQSGTGKNRLFLQSNLPTNGEVHLVAGEDSAPGLVAVSGSMHVSGSLLPNEASTYNLGSPTQTWANLYTGDLHLNNDRGSWTIYEEPDMLVVVNNLTGKKYKMGLTPLEDDE